MEILDINDQLSHVNRCMTGLSGLLDGYQDIPVSGSELCSLLEAIQSLLTDVEQGSRNIALITKSA